MAASRMAAKKRDTADPEPRHDAPTREVDVLSAAFADHVLSAEIEAQRGERQTTRDFPTDPESTDQHADRAALEAARLIVVDEEARSPRPGEVRTVPPSPEVTRASRSRVLVLVLVLALAAGLVAWLAAASAR